MTTATLYEDVADRMQTLIEEGTLRAGDRIPSVRRLHRQWSVSMTTVLEAYRLLEDRGWVEARPRSGYYVRPNPRLAVAEPRVTEPPRQPQRVRTNLLMRMHSEINAEGFVRLGAAVPDLALLPHQQLARRVSEMMRRHPTRCHAYQTGAGYEPLRREIARRMVDAGCTVSPQELIITSGAQEALYLALRAVTKPGDLVAVESPCYMGLLEILETLHLKALELSTHPRHGINLDALDHALGQSDVAACAVAANYSNPLGCCLSDEAKQKLVEIVTHHRVPLVEDDIYGELPFDGPRPRAAKSFDTEGLVIYCSSYSKTISPGFRVGWTLPGRFHEQLLWLKSMTSIAAPSIPQLAIAAYLQEGGYDRRLRRLSKVYRDNHARVIAAIGRYFPAGTRATQPTGGQLLWVEMPRGVSGVKLYEQVAEHRISVAPGVMFSASGRYEHCLRLNLALRYDERVEAALQTLGRLASAQLE